LATAVIAHETIDLAVAALQSNWLIPNPTRTPAAPHGLILSSLWASEDTTEKPRKPRKTEEHSRIKCPIIDTAVSSSPGAWLSQGIVEKQIEDLNGIKQPTVSKQLARMTEIGMEYIEAKKTLGNDNNTRKALIK
jgi:hypothetical protein